MDIRINASLEFIDYPVSKKVIFGQKICKCLTAESHDFPNLPISVDILQETCNNLGEAELIAMSGGKVVIEKRNDINERWNSLFRKTANYISFMSDGDAALIKSSGFECTKATRQKKGKIEMIDNFLADVKTAKGTAEVSCKSVKGANGYVMIAADESARVTMVGDDILIEVNGAQVRIKTSTQSRSTFTDLPSKTTVGISMAAFNTVGCSPLSDVQTITPQ